MTLIISHLRGCDKKPTRISQISPMTTPTQISLIAPISIEGSGDPAQHSENS
jgi:hypothetical protein